MDGMPSPHQELADFLRRPRAASNPHRPGLPADGRVRRVPGLRREEVALLAGFRRITTPGWSKAAGSSRSAQVLDAIARALDLDEAGRTHLHDLVAAAGSPRARSRKTVQRVRPGLHQLLDSLVAQPALILGHRTDVLAANRLASALFTDFERMRPRERNYARWMLLSDEARALFLDWELQARNAVEGLGSMPGAHRRPRDTTARRRTLAGERRVPPMVVRAPGSPTHHGANGYITLSSARSPSTSRPSPSPPIASRPCTSTPPRGGSPSQQALSLLASWTRSGPRSAGGHPGPRPSRQPTPQVTHKSLTAPLRRRQRPLSP